MKHTKMVIAVALIMMAMHTRAQTQKPNIILILADDLGYKSLTCNGGNLYSTPNIDKLAQKGMRFTQCHASPTCSPSRLLLLTGKYNFRNYTEWGRMNPNEKTIGNMMKDAGYKTGFFGKDQLQGGGQSLNSWGFDNYCVHGAFEVSITGNPYKNPHLYTHGAFLPDSLTLNKYGPDIVSDSLLDFISRNKSNPFFIFYPMMMVHQPISPTPDDSAFADSIWDTKEHFDTSFYPSMMHYMDKKIGELVAKIKSLGIENNTIIIFSADNGTSGAVADYSEDSIIVPGGKHKTTKAGTHVPLIAYWPGTITAGTVNTDLIDFTDFLPTLAGVANISMPTNYGPIDGVSFSQRLIGQPGTPRNWIFNDYVLKHNPLVRWAQTKKYKLYDTSASEPKRLFYNIVADAKEKSPISDDSLTAHEAKIKQQLLDVINNYVAQGTPLISLNPSLSLITDSSVVLRDTIKTNGGSTVTASGAVWSTSPNPKVTSSPHTSSGVILGAFSTQVTGLTANTTYYIRAYATNFAGTAYSKQIIFKTLLEVPVATKATGIDSNKFTANWKVYTGATRYRLDVSTSSAFTRIKTSTITEGFNKGIIPPAGWAISNTIIADTSVFGALSPSLKFTHSKAKIITKELSGPAIELSFWIKASGANQSGSLLVEGFDGNNWTVITTLTKLPKAGAKKTFNTTSDPPLSQNFIQFRFTYTKKEGKLAFDDVSIKYNKPVPFFIPGYHDLSVKTNAQIVTGLKAATKYYYRVRAVTDSATTGNSNVIPVTTHKTSVMNETNIAIDSSSVNAERSSGLNIQVFPNPSATEFVLAVQTNRNEKLEITVTNISGKKLYQSTGSNNGKYIFGKTFAPGVYVVRVVQGKNIQTTKMIKEE